MGLGVAVYGPRCCGLREIFLDRTGARLYLSAHTVHRHVSNILTKLDLPSRTAAVAHATRSGLL